MPERTRPARPAAPWYRLSMRAWLGLLAALVAGLLLFASLVPKRDGAATVDAVGADADGRDTAALPAPMPAGTGSTSGMDTTPPERAPPLQGAPPAAVATQPTDTGTGDPGGDTPAPMPGADTAPVAIDSPSPAYPREALRRGDSGEVQLRVTVGADGVPTDVEVSRSSRSRVLDRAAVAAVRRWRYRPARAGNQPVPSTTQASITFAPGG